MSTIILYDNLHPSGYIFKSLQYIVLAKRKSVKRQGDDHHDYRIRVEDKVKDRPFAEGDAA